MASPADNRISPTRNLLIVDDEDHIRLGLSLTMRKAGFKVDLASDGAEALKRLHAAPPVDLMILDLRMPLMSGTHVMAAMKADGIATLVVGITGCAEADALTRMLQAGCAAVVSKPFPADELLAIVEQVMGAAAAGSKERA